MVMYCMRFANSQLLRSWSSNPGSSDGCSGAASASERVRFRDTMEAVRDRETAAAALEEFRSIARVRRGCGGVDLAR